MSSKNPYIILFAILVATAMLHAWFDPLSEPYFNNDETRHLMTGVFFRDFFHDLPLLHLRDYVVRYYLQYPALGLLVWPPMFYVAEGLFMLVCGSSFLAGKLLILAFAGLSIFFLFQLVRLTHGLFIASLACLFMAISPLFFLFSQHVMLEIPALAFSLGTLYFLFRYLEEPRPHFILFTSLFCAMALLTRFDSLFLFPTCLMIILFRKQSRVLLRKDVILSTLLCFVLIAPLYAITIVEFGRSHIQAIRSGTASNSTHFLAPGNFIYYPGVILTQLGWPLLVASGFGAIAQFVNPKWKTTFPYLALIIGTYITFTPMAELEPRHAIYWVPGLVLFAAAGIARMLTMGPKIIAFVIAAACLLGTAYGTLEKDSGYLMGYEEAAHFVVRNTKASHLCLFDNYLNGSFIYYIRELDRERSMGVLRGDKLFYGVMSDPHAAYKELALSKGDIIKGIYKLDPEYIVVESPQVKFVLPMATLLRQVLEESKERFQLVKVVSLTSNQKMFSGISLLIYHNIVRNPNPESLLKLEMVGMGHSLDISPTAPNLGQ